MLFTPVCAKLPLPGKTDDACPTGSNSKGARSESKTGKDFVVTFHLQSLGICLITPLLGALHQNKDKGPEKGANAFVMMANQPSAPGQNLTLPVS